MSEPEYELTEEILSQFRDKDSKKQHYLELYQTHDYLTAYSKQTDMRVEDDPIWAIGRGDEWDSHGLLQRGFLVGLGMLPYHKLLDIGCGVGRAARRFVPYLDKGNYTGIDISPKAIAHAMELSKEEGWADKKPTFLLNSNVNIDGEFDFMWAHSVFTHSPPDQIEKMIANAAKRCRKKFAFTYKLSEAPIRTGLKQFAYPPSFFEEIAKNNGLSFYNHPERWPAGQRTIVLSRNES